MIDALGRLPEHKRPLKQRIFAFVLSAVIAPVLGFSAVRLALSTWPLHTGRLLVLQLVSLLLATLLCGFALLLLIPPIRRKLKTGRFLLAPAEVAQKNREANSRYGAGKPLGPQLWIWTLPALVSAVLVTLGAVLASFAWDVTGCKDCSNVTAASVLIVALGTSLIVIGLIYPFKSIRRKLQTGSFLPSGEELAVRRAKLAQPKPLRTRIVIAIVWWFNAALWIDSLIGRLHYPSRHTGSTLWVTALLATFAAVVWTMQIFRPRSATADALED